MKHRDQYIWLSVPGGVEGVPLEWINERISYYNRHICPFYNGDFWEWLSWDTGDTFYGFSALWNYKNPLFSEVKQIRGGASHV